MRVEGVDISSDEDVLDTGSMLAIGLQSNLKANPATLTSPSRMSTASINSPSRMATKEDGVSFAPGTEKVLDALYMIRDGLIEDFSSIKLGSKLSASITNKINHIGGCIRILGGSAEKFEPLNHVSGLTIPDQTRNAERVVENTIGCYSLGIAKNIEIGKNGKSIVISFCGCDGDNQYEAKGTIVAEEWNGNEAIDYVYTPGSGRMSVRAFENGRWADKSDKYDIRWELFEGNGENDNASDNQEENPVEEVCDDKIDEGEEAIKKEEGKKEINSNKNTIKENDVDEEDEEVEDFDIST